MTNKQPDQQYEIGMVGLGVMGRNLLLNMADHGFSVAGYDKDPSKVDVLRQGAKDREIRGASNIKEFIGVLRQPRAVMMLVPAGAPVDSVILDVAKQKGTGMWTSQSAMGLQVPIPTIDLAVAMRDLSVFEKVREQASAIYQRPIKQLKSGRSTFLKQLHDALYAAMIITYAQGLALLVVALDKYQYQIDLESVALIWRGGCIIRAALLDNICAAFHTKRDLSNLLLDPNISRKMMVHQESLHQVICQAAEAGVPVPGLMVSLGYFDAYRSAWLPANLIQAQREYFGAHTYERIDSKGTFHIEWEKKV